MVLFNSSLREIQNSETQKKKYGSMVKRLRHRPFTAVTGVQIPLESYNIIDWNNICRHGSMAEQLICNQQVIGSSPIIGFLDL